ncbi:interferon lambda-2-like [Thomomys bottae]
MLQDMSGHHRLLLALLMAWALGSTQAAPVTKALQRQPDAGDCHLDQFQSLSPQEFQAFRRAKDALRANLHPSCRGLAPALSAMCKPPSWRGAAIFLRVDVSSEQSLLQKDVKCSSHVFPRARDLRQLQVWERPRALGSELALTLKVLGSVADPALGDLLEQPLSTLHSIHSQLQACALAQPSANPRPHSRRLAHWLHRLQAALKKESPGCLQASVTFNLFHLLTRDLSCVIKGPQCK